MNAAPSQPLRLEAVLVRLCASLVALGALVQFVVLLGKAGTVRRAIPAAVSSAFWGYVLGGVAAVLACTLVLAIVWRAGHHRDARLLALFLACFAFFWATFFQFFQVSHGVNPAGADTLGVNVSLDATLGAAMLASWILAVASFLAFAAVFPSDAARPRWLSNRTIWIPALVIGALGFGVAAAIPIVGPRLASQALVLQVLIVLALITYLLVPALVIVYGVRLLIRNYRRADPEGRARALWIVAGFTVALGILLVTAAVVGFDLMPDRPQVVAFVIIVMPMLAALVIVLSISIAVFYSGTFDPRLVIQRTTAYAALGVLLTGLFALVENLISSTISRWLNLPASAATVFASMVVALAVVPLQKYVVPRLKRRLS